MQDDRVPGITRGITLGLGNLSVRPPPLNLTAPGGQEYHASPRTKNKRAKEMESSSSDAPLSSDAGSDCELGELHGGTFQRPVARRVRPSTSMPSARPGVGGAGSGAGRMEEGTSPTRLPSLVPGFSPITHTHDPDAPFSAPYVGVPPFVRGASPSTPSSAGGRSTRLSRARTSRNSSRSMTPSTPNTPTLPWYEPTPDSPRVGSGAPSPQRRPSSWAPLPRCSGALVAACSYENAQGMAPLRHVREEADEVRSAFSDASVPCEVLTDPSLDGISAALRDHPETEALFVLSHSHRNSSLLVSGERPETIEASDNEAFTSAIKAAAPHGNLLVGLMNGCHSFEKSKRLSGSGAIPSVACWRGPVETSAARVFGVAFASALAEHEKVKKESNALNAFRKACWAVKRLTELRVKRDGTGSTTYLTTKYAFADPTGLGSAGRTADGRLAAGVPVLLINGAVVEQGFN
jgi:hypothetical protein